jgi:hypothetical protein
VPPGTTDRPLNVDAVIEDASYFDVEVDEAASIASRLPG